MEAEKAVKKRIGVAPGEREPDQCLQTDQTCKASRQRMVSDFVTRGLGHNRRCMNRKTETASGNVHTAIVRVVPWRDASQRTLGCSIKSLRHAANVRHYRLATTATKPNQGKQPCVECPHRLLSVPTTAPMTGQARPY
eukprot:1152645-Pelagomonas_calceolata.AAC.2